MIKKITLKQMLRCFELFFAERFQINLYISRDKQHDFVFHWSSSKWDGIIQSRWDDILYPIAVKYCQDGINEYCRDSTHYLLELDQRKSNNLDIQNKLIN